MAKRKKERKCEGCGAVLKVPRARKCKRCKAKPAVRIMPDGRRVDLKKQREKREAAKDKPPREIEQDAVAQMWNRTERRQRATIDEQRALDRVKAPRRDAERQIKTRAQVGKDSATPERAAKAGYDERIGEDGAQRLSDAPLDSLRSREVIELEQFEAGDRYREDCWKAGIIKSPVPDFQAVGGGFGSKVPGFVASEAKAGAMDRVNAADSALGVGLVDVVKTVVLATAGETIKDIGIKLFGRKDRNQAGAALVEVLKIGLNRLAAHYGGKQIDDAGEIVERPRRTRVLGEKVAVDETQWLKNGSEG